MTPNKLKGFTLIEFVVVVVIIGIMASYALFRWNGTKMITRSQANRMVYDLRYAQSLAMAKDAVYRVNILSNNTYSITDQAGTAILDPTTQTSIITLEQGSGFGTIGNLPNNLISFDGKGTPYTDITATTPLANKAVITINNNGIAHIVAILPETGFTHVE